LDPSSSPSTTQSPPTGEILVGGANEVLRAESTKWRRFAQKAELFELECMVFDRVSWPDMPAFHNTLVVGSSPTGQADRRYRRLAVHFLVLDAAPTSPEGRVVKKAEENPLLLGTSLSPRIFLAQGAD